MESQKDVVIAVMGATGSGKSTFINLVSGANLGVGNGLLFCHSDVDSHVFEFLGRRIILIDTPGFDDTTKSEADILQMIATHLVMTYEASIKLSGIIYTHRISDVRVGGVSRRNLRMFRGLCGEDVLRNVLIVTTMWDKGDLDICKMREYELKMDEILFKPILDTGAQMVRHDNTLKSAQAILQHLVFNQREKKNIPETDADEELARKLATVMKKHREDLDNIRKEMAEALAHMHLN